MLTKERVLAEIAKAPHKLRSLVKDVVIHQDECPQNCEWAQSTGNPNFKAAATAQTSDMTLHFWGNYDGSNLRYVVLHELGHLLDRKLGRRAADKARRAYGRKVIRESFTGSTPEGIYRWWFSNQGRTWIKAMEADSLQNPQAHRDMIYVSDYASHHKSAVEDFAESVAFMVMHPSQFTTHHPHRAKIIAKALGY